MDQVPSSGKLPTEMHDAFIPPCTSLLYFMHISYGVGHVPVSLVVNNSHLSLIVSGRSVAARNSARHVVVAPTGAVLPLYSKSFWETSSRNVGAANSRRKVLSFFGKNFETNERNHSLEFWLSPKFYFPKTEFHFQIPFSQNEILKKNTT